MLTAPDVPGAPVTSVTDERLRLLFTCCHPALAMDARVALTLRALGGLTTAEIARAFLVPEPTMAQRPSRPLFAAAWPAGQQPPPDERAAYESGAARDDDARAHRQISRTRRSSRRPRHRPPRRRR